MVEFDTALNLADSIGLFLSGYPHFEKLMNGSVTVLDYIKPRLEILLSIQGWSLHSIAVVGADPDKGLIPMMTLGGDVGEAIDYNIMLINSTVIVTFYIHDQLYAVSSPLTP